jgi:NTE family protein
MQAARRLVAKLPASLRDDADAKALGRLPADAAVTVVHLIYRSKHYESQSKDYEFSRTSMLEHWAAGIADTTQTLTDPRWLQRKPIASGVEVFDLTSARPLAATVTPNPLPGGRVA